MINLLEHFALAGTRVVRLHAELKHHVKPDDNIQARVELKLSPAELPDQTHSQFQIGAALICDGVLKTIDQDTPAFRIECTFNAVYQQVSGGVIDFDLIRDSHASLTRQLYPLIHQQIMPTFHLLGLHQVRLPQDFLPGKSEVVPDQVH